MDNRREISPPKVRLNSTPLRRMNTVGSASRSNRRKHSSVAALYTPQNAHQPMGEPKEEEPATTNGYRKLSIGSRSPRSTERAKKRISGINFNIPVVTTGASGSANANATSDGALRSVSVSPSPAQVQFSPDGSNTHFDRPSSVDSIPSPTPAGAAAAAKLSSLQVGQFDTPITPTPTQQRFEQATHLAAEDVSTNNSAVQPDPLVVQLRELAAKEAELFEIKETIKNLTTRKRSMELEFDAMKKAVERSLHQQIVPTTTSRKSHSSITSPKFMRSPIKTHHRSVSDHPLDDNFNYVTGSSSSGAHSHGQDPTEAHDKKSNRKHTGLWGIISQVDNYIQSEFEKFNIIDMNPGHDSPDAPHNLNESFYQIPENADIPSEDNRIKRLLDGSHQHSLLPQSIRNVVDAVIYGSIEEERESDEPRHDAADSRTSAAHLAAAHPVSTSKPAAARQKSQKSVEMRDMSATESAGSHKDADAAADEWDNNDFSFTGED